MKMSTNNKFSIGVVSELTSSMPHILLQHDRNGAVYIRLVDLLEKDLQKKDVDLLSMDKPVSVLCNGALLLVNEHWDEKYFDMFPEFDLINKPVFLIWINRGRKTWFHSNKINYPNNVYVVNINRESMACDYNCVIHNTGTKSISDLGCSGTIEDISDWLSGIIATTIKRYARISEVVPPRKQKQEPVKVEQTPPSPPQNNFPGFAVSISLAENQIQEIVNRVANIQNQTSLQSQNTLLPQLKTMSTNLMEKMDEVTNLSQKLSRLETAILRIAQTQDQINSQINHLTQSLGARDDIDDIIKAITKSTEEVSKKIGSLNIVNFVSGIKKKAAAQQEEPNLEVVVIEEEITNTKENTEPEMFDLDTYLLNIDEKLTKASSALEINFDSFTIKDLKKREVLIENLKRFETLFLKDVNTHINHRDVENLILFICPEAKSNMVHFWAGLSKRKIELYGALLALKPLGGWKNFSYDQFPTTKWFAMFTTFLKSCGLQWKK